MRVTGKMIYSMDMAKRSGLMDQSMRENILMGKNMVKEHIYGQMGAHTQEIGLIIRLRE